MSMSQVFLVGGHAATGCLPHSARFPRVTHSTASRPHRTSPCCGSSGGRVLGAGDVRELRTPCERYDYFVALLAPGLPASA